jgi:hypothetical protein
MAEGAPPGMRITQRDLMEATDLDFEEMKENWNTYKLSDGTTLKVKLVLRGVKRFKKWNPDGTPLYLISARNIVRAVNVPENVRMKPKDRSFKPV